MPPVKSLTDNTSVSLGIVFTVITSLVAGAFYTGILREGIRRDSLEAAEWRKATNTILDKVTDNMTEVIAITKDNRTRIDHLDEKVKSITK